MDFPEILDDGSISQEPRPSTIDPGEALFCMTGLVPIVANVKISAAAFQGAQALDEACAKLAVKLVRGELGGPHKPDTSSYNRMLTILTNGITDDQLQAVMGRFEEPHIAMAYMHIGKQVCDFLTARIPKVVFKGVAATVNLEPSDSEWWTFQDLYELVNAPLSVYELCANGELLPSQVQVLETLFPEFLMTVRVCVDTAISDELARVRSFELPVAVEFGVATLRGAPVDPMPYQDAYMMPAATRDIAPSPSKARSPLAVEAESSVERALRPVGH